jgi:Dolichyl-phosphate-mannose-protein mannosyltransferase
MAAASRAVLWPFLISRLVVLVATEMGAFLAAPALEKPQPALADFYHWDAYRYAAIWQHGYQDVVSSAFFPLFPYTVKALGRVIDLQLAGLLIPEVALFLGMMLVYATGRRLIGQSGAALTVWILAFWPWSVFFSYPYTESLLLLMTAASFWLGDQRRWLLAGVAGALAAASRAPGILLEFAFGAELLRMFRGRQWPRGGQAPGLVAAMVLTALGLVAVGLVLQNQTGDPMGFVRGQEAFVVHRNPLFPIGAVVEMIRNLNPYKVEGLGLPVVVAFGAATVWAVRRLPWRYAAYTLVFFLLCVYQGWHLGQYHSEPRYLVAVFPAYFAFARLLEQRPGLQRPWLAVSGSMMAIESALYGAGKFIG